MIFINWSNVYAPALPNSRFLNTMKYRYLSPALSAHLRIGFPLRSSLLLRSLPLYSISTNPPDFTIPKKSGQWFMKPINRKSSQSMIRCRHLTLPSTAVALIESPHSATNKPYSFGSSKTPSRIAPFRQPRICSLGKLRTVSMDGREYR